MAVVVVSLFFMCQKNIKYINSQTQGILHALHEIADAI